MDRNMRNQHSMMSNMSKRHQSHHQQHHSHSMAQQTMPVQNHHQNRDNSASLPSGTQQNEDLIKFIEDAWHKVTSEHGPYVGVTKFYSNASEPQVLANFEPFDLEGYWGRRMVQNLHISRGHQ